MQKKTILCVEDDQPLQNVIKQYFENEGHKVLTASTAHEGLEKVRDASISVVLLDLGLPDEDGLYVLSQIREHTAAPVIVVSGKDDTTDRIVGLEMGADDYMTKPFEMRELYARIKAVLRRSEDEGGAKKQSVEKPEIQKISFGPWVLDKGRYDLFNERDEAVGLTTAEFKLLEALVNAPHRTLSRDQLFERTRGTEYEAYDRAIDIHIARIRKKLGDEPKSPKIIKTIRGVGYMFCADTKAIA